MTNALSRSFIAVGAAALIAVGLTACGGADEAAVEQAIENANPSIDADVQDGGGGIKATDKAGNEVGVGSSAKVPDGFPSVVPLPEGTLQVAGKSADGTFSLTYQVSSDPAGAATAYKSQLTDAGFTVTSDAATEALGGFEATGNGYKVIVLSIGTAGATGLTVAVEKE